MGYIIYIILSVGNIKRKSTSLMWPIVIKNSQVSLSQVLIKYVHINESALDNQFGL